MKLKGLLMFLLAIILLVLAYYQNLWSADFVDPCCSGLCGVCPPSFWECIFMGFSSLFLTIIATVLIAVGIFELFDLEEKTK